VGKTVKIIIIIALALLLVLLLPVFILFIFGIIIGSLALHPTPEQMEAARIAYTVIAIPILVLIIIVSGVLVKLIKSVRSK
jgi:hypothetical protein